MDGAKSMFKKEKKEHSEVSRDCFMGKVHRTWKLERKVREAGGKASRDVDQQEERGEEGGTGGRVQSWWWAILAESKYIQESGEILQ